MTFTKLEDRMHRYLLKTGEWTSKQKLIQIAKSKGHTMLEIAPALRELEHMVDVGALWHNEEDALKMRLTGGADMYYRGYEMTPEEIEARRINLAAYDGEDW